MDVSAGVFCSQCGQAFSRSEVVNLAGTTVCAACKPAFLRKLQEGAAPAGAMVYKGFWIRLLAKIVDGIVVDIAIFLLAVPFIAFMIPAMRRFNPQAGQPLPPAQVAGFLAAMSVLYLLAFLIVVAYNTLMLGRFGTTVGKLAINAKVVTPEGAPIGYGKALGRSLMEIVNALTLEIGYIVAAFDSQKRGLHDRVAGTVVVARQ